MLFLKNVLWLYFYSRGIERNITGNLKEAFGIKSSPLPPDNAIP